MNYGMPTAFVTDLIKKYGSPLYVFDKTGFEENYKSLLNAFRNIYPKYNIAYSYKTNYTPKICELVKNLGGYAEVVSGMEYALAKRIGYENENIIYNGPIKGSQMYEHIKAGGTLNVDNIDEFENIERYAVEHKNEQIKLAFRVNLDIGQGFISRFGIDISNGDLDSTIEKAKKIENIRIVGLHCHIGRSRSLNAWKQRVDQILPIVDKYFSKPPKFIDLGSGMNSVMEPSLAEQFGGNIPSFTDYAAIVATAFKEKYGMLPTEQMPELITEPGTTLVSGFLSFLTTVKCIKHIKGKTFATFDGSNGNMGDICGLKQLPISVHAGGIKRNEVTDTDFTGYTCIEHDVMYKGYTGPLGVDDIVEFRNVGSYSNVFKPPFIYPNCAMVSVDSDGNTELIKETEDFDYIFEKYIF